MSDQVIKTRDASLRTMLGGAVIEMFDAELDKAGVNIMDPNTEADAVRKITLTVDIKPHHSREMAEFSAKVESKLAGDKAQKGTFFVSRTMSGQTRLSEKNARQMDLEEEVAKKTVADVPRSAIATSSLDAEDEERQR